MKDIISTSNSSVMMNNNRTTYIFLLHLFDINILILGEGIAVVDDIIYMLTWKEKKLMMFNSETLEVQKIITRDKFPFSLF